jgi:hypothetical protein
MVVIRRLFGGIHNNRFKTFAHDGVFNTQSMFGTTEFSSAIGILVDIGKDNAIAQKPIPHSTLLI